MLLCVSMMNEARPDTSNLLASKKLAPLGELKKSLLHQTFSGQP